MTTTTSPSSQLEWLNEERVPVVLTLCSSSAETVCQRNGLSFTEMLRPFGKSDARWTIRTLSSKNISIESFRCKFLSPHDYEEVDSKKLTAGFSDLANRYQPKFQSPTLSDEERVSAERVRRSLENEKAPWISNWSRAYVKSIKCKSHEMFEQPVAMLCVASTADEDPMRCFETLSAATATSRQSAAVRLPKPFRNKQYDSGIRRFYVLIHDVTGQRNVVEADKVLRKMQSAFTSQRCFKIEINSSSSAGGSGGVVGDDMWSKYLESWQMRKDKSQKLGQHLSDSDLKSLQMFVTTLSKNCVLPAIEQTILTLGKEIKSQTGGFFRMAKFMRTAKRLTQEQASRGVLLYPFNSVEAQIRRYADLLFMLGHYSMAQEQYEKIRSDFQQDKSWAHLAGTMEMIGICKLLVASKKSKQISKSTSDSVMDCMMNAVERYGRMSEKDPSRTKLMTRSTLLLVECCRALGSSYMRVAAETLVKSSSAETQLCSALMLQDAAFCYLHARPLSFNRKCTFHLVLAGHLFHKCGQRQHAVYCYLSAICIYRGLGWKYIDDHIHFTLGRQFYGLSGFEAAVYFYLQLIATGRQDSKRQRLYMNEFLLVVKAWVNSQSSPSSNDRRRKFEIENLPLPHVDDTNISVLTAHNAADDQTGSVSSSDPRAGMLWHSKRSEMWRQLKTTTWWEENEDADDEDDVLDNQRPDGTDNVRTIAIGEPVVVVLTLRNPLSNPIYVDDIQLYAEIVDSKEKEKPLSPKSLKRRRSNSKIRLLDDKDFPSADDVSNIGEEEKEKEKEEEEEENKNKSETSTHIFDVEPISLQFKPKSSRVVYLRIVPKVSGSFRIVGVRWNLRRGVTGREGEKVDSVFGRHAFMLPGRPLNRTRRQRSSGARALDMRLHFKVIEARPWLGVKLQEEETTQSMYQGEMKCLRFSIRNHGNAKITSLRVMCCNPVFSICCTESRKNNKSSFAECGDVLGRIINISIDEALNSSDKKSQDIDLWIRATASGQHDLQILFNYEGPPHSASGSGERDERWRSVEFSKRLEILPSLQVRSHVISNFVSTTKYNVQVRVKNVSNRAICLRDVTAISNVWNVTPRHVDNENSMILPNHVVVFHGIMSRDLENDKRRTASFSLDTSNDVEEEEIEWIRSSMFHDSEEDAKKLAHDVSTYFLLLDNAPRALSVVRDAMRRKQEKSAMETQQKMWERNADDEQREAEREAAAQTPTRQRLNTPQSPLTDIPEWIENSALPPLPIDSDALFVGGPERGDELHVQVEWSTEQNISGCHQLLRVPVRTRPEEGTTCPLHITVSYPKYVTHDFNESFCSVPVRIRILNTAVPGTRRLSVNVDILSDYVQMKSFAGELGICNKKNITTTLTPRVSWIGHRKRHIHRIASGETVDIHLQAIFAEPGVYDLNRFQFTLLRGLKGTGRNTMFLFPYQYLISVSSNDDDDNDVGREVQKKLIDLEREHTIFSNDTVLMNVEKKEADDEDALGLFCDSSPVVKKKDPEVVKLFDREASSNSNDLIEIGDGCSLFDREPPSADASTLFDSKPPTEQKKEDEDLLLNNIFDQDHHSNMDKEKTSSNDDLDLLFGSEPAT